MPTPPPPTSMPSPSASGSSFPSASPPPRPRSASKRRSGQLAASSSSTLSLIDSSSSLARRDPLTPPATTFAALSVQPISAEDHYLFRAHSPAHTLASSAPTPSLGLQLHAARSASPAPVSAFTHSTSSAPHRPTQQPHPSVSEAAAGSNVAPPQAPPTYTSATYSSFPTSSSSSQPASPLAPSPTHQFIAYPRAHRTSRSAHRRLALPTLSIPGLASASGGGHPSVAWSHSMNYLGRRGLRVSHGSSKKTQPRRFVLIFLVLLSLVLVGTVIVLSTVRHYFGVPTDAYLSEDEVPWHPRDVIPPLRDLEATADNLTDGGVARRADEHATQTGEGAAVWDHLIEDEKVDDATAADAAVSAQIDSNDDIWGVDGKGSGGYWMRADWDGRVRDTHSWDRLYNVTVREGEKAPRIIHQTWKSDVMPDKWRKAWKECREGMPDYEYMLWTDELAREFVKEHYPAQLHMYDHYMYPIQRADSIRYFILHHFGGIYMDLDIGCRRRIDPLLQGDWEVVLPITKPVGVSNDMIVSSRGSAFMDAAVHGLAAFDHDYVSNYPTVMFSTGPMFLSAQFGIYYKSHPVTAANPHAEVRILPQSLYGKNAPAEKVPHSFFSHFYGSSWHADDAGFITWLGKWGRMLMYIGMAVVIIGAIRLILSRPRSSIRAFLLGSKAQEYQLLPIINTSPPSDNGYTSPTSSLSSGPLSPTAFENNHPDLSRRLRRASNLLVAAPAAVVAGRKSQRGWLYFAPALFQPSSSRRRRERERDEERDAERSSQPPPYEDGMDEVDAFLKTNDGNDDGLSEASASTSSAL